MEMESARKQLDIYKKEWRTNKKRYEEIDDPTRIIKVEQKIIEIERSITTETANNKALTKELREKNKLIDFLQSAAIINPKVKTLLFSVKIQPFSLRKLSKEMESNT